MTDTIAGLQELEDTGKQWAMTGWLAARGLITDRQMIGASRKALEMWNIEDETIMLALAEFDEWWLPSTGHANACPTCGHAQSSSS